MAEPERLTDHEWGRQVGCTDQSTGKIGLFTLLRLVADHYGHGIGYATTYSTSTLLDCLREADPEMRHWHLQVGADPRVVSIWRRKEWNESIAKQKLDEEKKSVALITQAEYAEAKAIVMEMLMLMCDNDKRTAEKMFYAQGLANDQQLLIKKAAKLSGMKERHAEKAESNKASPELVTKIQALRLKLQGGKKP